MTKFESMANQVQTDLAKESLRDHKGVDWDRYQAVCDELEGAEYEIEQLKAKIEIDRIPLLQYESLRGHFQSMVNDVLGKDYYNMGMDVYECDRICCEDITFKAKSWWKKL